MPSSHSQFMGFFTSFILLFIFTRQMHTYNSPIGKSIRAGLVSFTVFIDLTVCVSRVYLGYHTGAQVFVGQVLGVGFGVGWFYLLKDHAVPRFNKAVSW